MKNCLNLLTVLLGLMLCASLPIWAQINVDRPNLQTGENRRPVRPQNGNASESANRFRGGQGLPLMEAVLTDDQRDSLRQVMEAQRGKIRELLEKMRDARKALMTAALLDDFKEDVVRAKALELAKLEADFTVLRLKAIAEIQPALSKEQLDKIMTAPAAPALDQAGDGLRPNNRRPARPAERQLGAPPAPPQN